MQELRELVRSAGVDILSELKSARRDPDPGTFLGSGKIQELHDLCAEQHADVAIFGAELSPSQERNIERELKCRVVDRTRLILDIFAQRAQSYEGKLQVELAQLRHMSTRLVRGWTHLERQKGGIGLRGPGEKQLETDRRLLNQRVKQIRQRLESVRGRRALSRRSRQRAEVPVVSLVGYTNAGKSTLFNTLTGSGVLAEDRLFATLDPTMRKVELSGGVKAILADTVGFVRNLPHELVAAFETTLEESREATMLLHVLDAADPEREAKSAQVHAVLARIGASKVPVLAVYNKIDAVPEMPARMDRGASGAVSAVWLSALTGDGVALLHDAIAERLRGSLQLYDVLVPWGAGAARSKLYAQLEIISESSANELGWTLRVRANADAVQAVAHALGPKILITAVPSAPLAAEPHVPDAVQLQAELDRDLVAVENNKLIPDSTDTAGSAAPVKLAQ